MTANPFENYGNSLDKFVATKSYVEMGTQVRGRKPLIRYAKNYHTTGVSQHHRKCHTTGQYALLIATSLYVLK